MQVRTQIAETVLVEYQRLKSEPLECLESSIIDLMTDLLHLANRESLDSLALAKVMQMHFEAEAGQVTLSKEEQDAEYYGIGLIYGEKILRDKVAVGRVLREAQFTSLS